MLMIYLYNELGEDHPLEITREEILKTYWPWWSKRMIEKFGPDHEWITEDYCVDDWVVVNWAWEKSENND